MPLDPHERESTERRISTIESELLALKKSPTPDQISRGVALQLELGKLIRLLAADGQPCPVCGFALSFLPWSEGLPSDEICPRCGIQFGYDDVAGGDLKKRDKVYSHWRDRWIAAGSPHLFPRISE